MSNRFTPPLERFWRNVEKTADCWIWIGVRSNRGYGHMRLNSRRVLVHRFAYEQFIGPIPAGLQVDHVCHSNDASCPGGFECLHRRCVNPDHLEAVTQRENILRGRSPMAGYAIQTHCKHGHEMTPENTYLRRDCWGRMCRTCGRERSRRQRTVQAEREREAAA